MQTANGDESTVRRIAEQLPKVQLHLHLDGSLSESFIAARAAHRNITLPCPPANLRAHLISLKQRALATDTHTQKPNSNWDIFTFCNQFLQTHEELHDATHHLVTHLATRHNCWVVEVRFCPALHLLENLSDDDAVRAVTAGFARAAAALPPHRLRGGVLLCALRSHDRAHVERTLRLAARWAGRGVLGADLAGDEGSFPLARHTAALSLASRLHVPLTLHAGEWAVHAPENVREALALGAARIGHALVLGRDDALAEEVRRAGVCVETCLTANCNSESKVPPGRYDLHPVRRMLEMGVRVAGFNCDNLLLSGTLQDRPDPCEEIVRAKMGCGLSWSNVREVLLEGVLASFAISEEDKEFVAAFTKVLDGALRDVLEEP